MKTVTKYLVKHTREIGDERKRHDPICKSCYGAAGFVLFIVLWSIGGHFVFSSPSFAQFSGFLPGPTLRALGKLFSEYDFWLSVVASLRRVIVGIGIAFIFGLPSGLLIGYSKRLRAASYPPVQFIRMISPLSWMPIALLVFATFESAIYFLITMATIWPIILNTSLGVARVNPQWIQMARIQGAKDHHILLHIILPASIPYILTSLRLAIGVAWIVLVPVEFLGVSSGLGYIINDARDTMEYDRLMATVLSIGVIGFFLDNSIQQARKAFKWTWVY